MQGKECREALFFLDNAPIQQILEEKLIKKEEKFVSYEKLTKEKLQLLLDKCL